MRSRTTQIEALKLDLYGLLYFSTFNIQKSREENSKWEKEQFIRKNEKVFVLLI